MDTLAVVLEEPGLLALRTLGLSAPTDDDVVVEVAWTGVSTGTERLLWDGRMPPFPGLAYPLVPGYEATGEVLWAGSESGHRRGERVFAPGSRGFIGAHGLFGAAARRIVAPGARVHRIDEGLGEEGCLLALAATAYHALPRAGDDGPVLIVGHGALGRLLARLLVARDPGRPPIVWERNPDRATGAEGYEVQPPGAKADEPFTTIIDVSGDPGILDHLFPVLARGGEVVLAGFYPDEVRFRFPPAFMKEARFRVAAEWTDSDLAEVNRMVTRGVLKLGGLVTHRAKAPTAASAYRTAFEDASCVKMILDWRDVA